MIDTQGQRTDAIEPDQEPDCPRVSVWRDGPELVKEWIWTHAEWAALPEAGRPDAAQPVEGIGFSLLRRYPAED